MLNEQDQQTTTLSRVHVKSRLVTKKPDMQQLKENLNALKIPCGKSRLARSHSYDKLPEFISLTAAELDKSI